MVGEPPHGLKPQVITSLAQFDCVIRAAVLRKDLSSRERDLLEQRLQATLDGLPESRSDVLETTLRVHRCERSRTLDGNQPVCPSAASYELLPATRHWQRMISRTLRLVAVQAIGVILSLKQVFRV